MLEKLKKLEQAYPTCIGFTYALITAFLMVLNAINVRELKALHFSYNYVLFYSYAFMSVSCFLISKNNKSKFY